MAAAIEIPRAADFPLPLPAVSATVDRRVFSLIASMNVSTALAWSIVFAKATRTPDGGVLASDALSSARSGESPSGAFGNNSKGPSAVTGRTFNSGKKVTAFCIQCAQGLQLTVIQYKARGAVPQRQQEAFVESRHNTLVRMSSKTAVHVHCHAVQLLQRRHCFEKKNHAAAAFDGLDGAREQVWGHSLKILKNKHPISVSQNGMSFIVVAVTNLCRRDEEFKRVILNSFDVDLATLCLFFDLLHALLLV
jgi:hypothetical protein